MVHLPGVGLKCFVELFPCLGFRSLDEEPRAKILCISSSSPESPMSPGFLYAVPSHLCSAPAPSTRSLSHAHRLVYARRGLLHRLEGPAICSNYQYTCRLWRLPSNREGLSLDIWHACWASPLPGPCSASRSGRSFSQTTSMVSVETLASGFGYCTLL